ncbi:hypothetical protein V7138_10990 [Bacillus sp. JJ1533]|uniref:hypothetical protein n=1 Tax=Bacillus sp. JJ1533 TaxID=3122959 RepID=UPI002FFDE1F1
MRLISMFLILSVFVGVLTGCHTTKRYHQAFKGTSDNWSVEWIETAMITFRNSKEFDDQYEVEYENLETLKLHYIGAESDLGQQVEFLYKNGRASVEASEGEVIEVGRIFSHTGATGSTTHIPKDMDFEPIQSKESILETTVKWNGKEESIELKYDEK